MSDTNARLKVAIVVLPKTTASTVYGMYDLFASTGRDWAFFVDGKPVANEVGMKMPVSSGAGSHARWA